MCLMHTPTKSLLSAYMSAERAHEATRLLSPSGVVCSKRAEPCSRNIFVIGRFESYTIVHVCLNTSAIYVYAVLLLGLKSNRVIGQIE